MCIVALKQFGCDRCRHHIENLIRSRPYFVQENCFTISICTDWLFCQIDVYCSSQRISHDQRWRSQETCTDLWMDSSFKVTITTQYCRYYKIVILYCFSNWLGKRAAVSDTIVDRYCVCYEGMLIVHHQVEHRSLT